MIVNEGVAMRPLILKGGNMYDSITINHKGLFTSNKQDWTTPKDLFNKLNEKYNFTLDACASDDNALCQKYYTENNSCLEYNWDNEIVFMNPPYKNIKIFMQKAYSEALKGCKIIVLAPARTDTTWFHNYVYHCKLCRIEFLKGRLKFGNSKSSAPFPSMLIYYNL